MKKLFKIIYGLGLRRAYENIDRLHYLKRLGRPKHPADDKFFASRDPEQFDPAKPICITDDFRGRHVAFMCDPGNHFERQIIRRGFSGHAVLEHMAAWARPGSIVIDVGANVGVYAVPLAAARADVSVFAFEPNREVAARLHENAALNCLKNLTIKPCALADAPGVMEFYQFDNDISLSSLNRHAAEIHGTPKRTEVQVETIDNLFAANEQRVSFIKIDVQGAELRVLRGAEKIVSAHRPVVLFEHEDSHFESLQLALAEKAAIDSFFAKNQYRCFYATRYDPKMLFPVDWHRPLHGDVLALPIGSGGDAS
ncbi:MAG: FkbM family methyltransferase [Burkholderiales bacterium]